MVHVTQLATSLQRHFSTEPEYITYSLEKSQFSSHSVGYRFLEKHTAIQFCTMQYPKFLHKMAMAWKSVCTKGH